jgi:hypothetical protein
VKAIRSLILSLIIGCMLTMATYFYSIRAGGVLGPGGRVPIDHGFPVPWVRESFAIPTMPTVANAFSLFWYGLGADLVFWTFIFYIGYRIVTHRRLTVKH